MPNEDITTPVAEVQATPEPTAEKTIGAALDIQEPAPEAPAEKPANTVPEHIFLAEKKARKELEKKLKDIESQKEEGVSKREISSNLSDIAKEYDIDPDFLDKFAKSIRSETEKDTEDKLSSKFKPLEEKDRQAKIDKNFEIHYAQAINAMPEFATIVNAGVIKALSLLPQNGNKTFSQLIEETYGNAISGKRTIPSTTLGGGKDSEPLDYQKANKDIDYFNQVMSNPKLKAEYNEKMLKSGY